MCVLVKSILPKCDNFLKSFQCLEYQRYCLYNLENIFNISC